MAPPLPSSPVVLEFVDHLTTLLADAVGDVVRDALEAEHERHSTHLQTLLEQQDARLVELLDHQAKRHAAEMALLMEAHAETLRTILRETPPPAAMTPMAQSTDSSREDAIAELQETLRLGFGELRAGLTQNQHTLATALRGELQPLVQAALSLARETTSTAKSPHPADTSPTDQTEPVLSPPMLVQVDPPSIPARTGDPPAPAWQAHNIARTDPIHCEAHSHSPHARPPIPDEHTLEVTS